MIRERYNIGSLMKIFSPWGFIKVPLCSRYIHILNWYSFSAAINHSASTQNNILLLTNTSMLVLSLIKHSVSSFTSHHIFLATTPYLTWNLSLSPAMWSLTVNGELIVVLNQTIRPCELDHCLTRRRRVRLSSTLPRFFRRHLKLKLGLRSRLSWITCRLMI